MPGVSEVNDRIYVAIEIRLIIIKIITIIINIMERRRPGPLADQLSSICLALTLGSIEGINNDESYNNTTTF